MKALHASAGRRLPPAYVGAAFFARMAAEGAPVVIVLLALHRTGEAWLGGLLVAAATLPHVITGPLAGRVRDRTGHPVAVTVAAALIVAAALAALAGTTGVAAWPVVALFAVIAGTVEPLLLGGLSSLIGALVPADRRHTAHAVDAATYNVAGIAGPAAGAAIATVASPAIALVSLAAAAALGAGFAAGLPRLPGPSAGAESAGWADGFRWIWRTPILRTTTVVTTLAHGGLGGLAVVAPILAVHLGASENVGGLFISVFAAGAAAGSLAISHPSARRLAPVPVVLTSLAVMAGGLALGAVASSVAVAACGFAIAGLADGPLLTTTLHVRTMTSPAPVRTQVFMVGASLKLTFSAVGAAAFGLLADVGGPTLLAVAAVVVVASILPGLGARNHAITDRRSHGRVTT
ncbi:MFS transporter [Phytoactinopolyspora alkaliphila]|uniref:MFS transporter n=1 Tax=Phytoactinopolyspora alkaliphila TaxID=1783498 RepID=A0A6N9YHA8_9ACTN|nr:MFS transporter [Phytoactinopolyspora alkaliphila]NED94310.1 MFS transporter [Phytoactinopolyspora alkaliphila]